jgi:endo-1,4-beta-xylanase
MRVRASIGVMLAALAVAAPAAARDIEPAQWASADAALKVKGDRLSVTVPGAISTELQTRELRELSLRFQEGCALTGALSVDGVPSRDFEVKSKGGRIALRARAEPGVHNLRVALEPQGRCGRTVIESSSIREWIAIGTELSAKYMESDRKYSDLITDKADSLTLGTDFQWREVEPKQGVFDFTGADAMVAFADEHGMETRGHPLVWRHYIPGYVKRGSLTRAELIEIMRVHIQTIVGRYAGVVEEWDVVNEAISDEGRLRDVFWRRKIGRDYIALAFLFAHEADPGARLFLNDYETEEQNQKSNGLYRLARGLVEAGVPIDGVGFQYHATTDKYPDPDEMTDNLRRFEDLGLAVQITEADVANYTADPDSAKRRQLQADGFEAGARACKRVLACDRFTMWGLSDTYSWLGERHEPLPFDSQLESKPSWAALTDQLRPR